MIGTYGPPKKTLTSSAARIIIFRKENLNHLIVCFTTCTLFFHVRFLFSICLPGVICGTYVTRINVVSSHFARQTLWSRRLLVYFACLRSHVFRAYCNFESKQAISITLFGRRPNN